MGCCAMVGGNDKLIEFIPLCVQKIFKTLLISQSNTPVFLFKGTCLV